MKMLAIILICLVLVGCNDQDPMSYINQALQVVDQLEGRKQSIRRPVYGSRAPVYSRPREYDRRRELERLKRENRLLHEELGRREAKDRYEDFSL